MDLSWVPLWREKEGAVRALDPEAEKALQRFLEELVQLLRGRLRRVYGRAANPRAGADPMADIDILLVVDELSKPEVYRVWNLAGEASVKYDVIFSVQSYSSADFEERKNLPVLRAFVTEGTEYGTT